MAGADGCIKPSAPTARTGAGRVEHDLMEASVPQGMRVCGDIVMKKW